MNETVLEMRHVTKRFPGVIALDDVNLDLRKGEILGICGENGAGKSTLMKVLSGSFASREYEGEIVIDGKPQTFDNVAMAQSSGIEMVYQEMNMMLDSSVAENLFVGNLPGRRGWVDYKTLYANTRELLKQAGLDLDPGELVRPLNSGQMQMLSLMRAVAKKPRILVLDEPTTALTDSEVEILMKLLGQLRDSGVSCIYISHKLEEIYKLCDRVLVLRDGHTISCYDIDKVVEATLIEEMVGRKVENLYPKTSHVCEEEVLRVEHLSVPHPNIRGKYIVEDISFSLKKGEILGIGGLVGAGRSESLGAVFGQYTNHVKKEVYIEGQKVEINSPKDAIANGIGFVTEERKRNGIIWMLSIRENVAVASLDKITSGMFIDEKKEEEQVKELSDKLRIKAPNLETKLIQLSGGNQQKVILAKWLLNNPKILFMDEPTKGIDVGTKADFYQLMSDLTKQGVSIVMVSSDMPELISMSDRCLVISNGRITAELEKEQINEINVMRAAIAE
ncbi:MAG: sugar ABC transporter ATP-binding protein [Hungatella sp.]|nr:sugar ABC transporter ATP-binding protein [Hungatella sp.]